MTDIRVDSELTVRPFTAEDAEAFYDLISTNRVYLCMWMPVFEHVHSVEDQRKGLEGLAALHSEGDILGGAIDYRGRLVGGASVNGLNSDNRTAMLGYWIAEEFQGRGIATRVCSVLVDRAFEERAINRVEVRVMALNARSCAVAERLGFTLEGVLRESFLCGGRVHDLAVYALLASERTRSGP